MRLSLFAFAYNKQFIAQASELQQNCSVVDLQILCLLVFYLDVWILH